MRYYRHISVGLLFLASAALASDAPLSRNDFNRAAAELYLPLFWRDDVNQNAKIDPAELVVYWGITGAKRGDWVDGRNFTKRFDEALTWIRARAAGSETGKLSPAEQKRLELVRKELSQGRQTLAELDASTFSANDKAIIANIFDAALAIERIYAQQRGMTTYANAAQDNESRFLFFRNQSPFCEAPLTQNEVECRGVNQKAKKVSGLYPESIQNNSKFCTEMLQTHKDAKTLLDPFTVVREDKGVLKAVSYADAYKSDMQLIAEKLRATAGLIKDAKEAAFKAYLLSAAQSFSDNNWQPADEAWAKMNVNNSAWYLRIGPDEVYSEPCNTKAMFHVSFARINQGSVAWQALLDPIKNDMEAALATLAGPPYKARSVSFHLPDFIDIILNAGDSRNAHGATIGQSLPNFGPVANEGRGRTVAMTNFYTDKDSVESLRQQASSMLDAATMAQFPVGDPKPLLTNTVLHEAAHNLGPAHQYQVNAKTDREVFGGPLASMLEEAKSEIASTYFVDWLVGRGKLSQAEADKARIAELVWALGHISRGMYDETGKSKPYSQLAAIELGFYLQDGAITWDGNATAANGKDKGALHIDQAKLRTSTQKLMQTVAQIKARGDKATAEALVKAHVDVSGDKKKLHETIQERFLRVPRASFVYAVKTE